MLFFKLRTLYNGNSLKVTKPKKKQFYLPSASKVLISKATTLKTEKIFDDDDNIVIINNNNNNNNNNSNNNNVSLVMRKLSCTI